MQLTISALFRSLIKTSFCFSLTTFHYQLGYLFQLLEMQDNALDFNFYLVFNVLYQGCQTGCLENKSGLPCSILCPKSYKFYCYIRHDKATFVNAIVQCSAIRDRFKLNTFFFLENRTF